MLSLSYEETKEVMMAVHRLKLMPVIFFGYLLVRESWPYYLRYRRPALALTIGCRRIDWRLWWLLAGFAVSWLATQLIIWFPAYSLQISNFYPVVQSVLFAVALVGNGPAWLLVSIILLGTALTIRFPSPIDYDFLLKSAAWPAIAWVGWKAWHVNPLVRRSAFWAFGIGWLAWMALLLVRAKYVVMHIEPHNTRPLFTGDEFARWAPYLVYHAFWMLGAIVFCLGAAETPRQPISFRNNVPEFKRQPLSLSR